MVVYPVIAYRYGDFEAHQFPIGVFSSLDTAKKEAVDYKNFRGLKYECVVYLYHLDQFGDEPEVAWKTSGMD